MRRTFTVLLILGLLLASVIPPTTALDPAELSDPFVIMDQDENDQTDPPNDIQFEAVNNTIIIGCGPAGDTASAGVHQLAFFKSTDGGENWTSQLISNSQERDDCDIAAENDQEYMIVYVNRGAKILVSGQVTDDGGSTWDFVNIDQEENDTFLKGVGVANTGDDSWITFYRDGPSDTMHAATTTDDYSTVNEYQWAPNIPSVNVGDVVETSGVYHLALGSTANETIFYAQGPAQGAQTVTNVSGDAVQLSAGIDVDGDNIVYAYTEDSTRNSVLRMSTDDGLSFGPDLTAVGSPAGLSRGVDAWIEGDEIAMLVPGPDQNFTISRSDDGGATFTDTELDAAESTNNVEQPAAVDIERLPNGRAFLAISFEERQFGTVEYNAFRDFGAVNQLPTASFTRDCDGLTCNFDASGSNDPDGTIDTYDWDFGDGDTSTGNTDPTISHTYDAEGEYTVTLTVTDSNNTQDSTSKTFSLSSTEGDPTEPQDGPQGADENTVRTQTSLNESSPGGIAVDPEDSDRWWLCAANATRVLLQETADAGGNFTNTTISNNVDASAGICSIDVWSSEQIAVHYSNATTTSPSPWAAVTSNGGSSWDRTNLAIDAGISASTYNHGAIWWYGDGTLGAASVNISGDRIEANKSIDAGVTWFAEDNNLIMTSFDNTDHDYFESTIRQGVEETDDIRFHGGSLPHTSASKDGGGDWTGNLAMNISLNLVDKNVAWDYVGSNTWWFVGQDDDNTVRVYKTTNAGTDWSQVLTIQPDATRKYDTITDMRVRDSTEIAFVGTTSNTEFCNSSTCTQLTFTKDAGSTWKHAVISNTTECECGDASLIIPKPGWYVAHAIDEVNNTRWVLRNVEPSTESVTLEAGSTGTGGFNELSEIRTDYTFKDANLWVREDPNVLRITRFDTDLTEETTIQPCSRFSEFDDDNLPTDHGLTVTTDNRPVYGCVQDGTNNVVLGKTDGSVDDWIIPDGGDRPFLLEARTGNKIINTNIAGSRVVDNNLTFARTLSIPFEVNSIAVSPGDNDWFAFTGPDGTRVYESFLEGRVMQDIGDVHNSIQVCDGELWTARSDQDLVKRWTFPKNGQRTLANQASIPTDDDHRLRITRDCQYLMIADTDTIRLAHAGNLSVIGTWTINGISGGIETFEMDPLNNYVYVANTDKIWRLHAYNVTESIAGDNPTGQLNPAPATEPFADEFTIQDTLEDPSAGDPSGIGGGGGGELFNLTAIAESFGGNTASAGVILGFLLIAMMGGAFMVMTGSAAGGIFGGFIGFVMSLAFGFIPTWLLVLIFAASIAIIVFWRS